MFKKVIRDKKQTESIDPILEIDAIERTIFIKVGIENGDEEPAPVVHYTLLETIDNFIIEFEKMVDLGHKSKETLKHWHSTKRKAYAINGLTSRKETWQVSIHEVIKVTFTFFDPSLYLEDKENKQMKKETQEKKQVKLCYEHIGGKLGSLLLEQFILKGWLSKEKGGDKYFSITDKGLTGFTKLGIDLSQIKS